MEEKACSAPATNTCRSLEDEIARMLTPGPLNGSVGIDSPPGQGSFSLITSIAV